MFDVLLEFTVHVYIDKDLLYNERYNTETGWGENLVGYVKVFRVIIKLEPLLVLIVTVNHIKVFFFEEL